MLLSCKSNTASASPIYRREVVEGDLEGREMSHWYIRIGGVLETAAFAVVL